MYDDDLTLVCPKCGCRTAARDSGQQNAIACRECGFKTLRSELLDTAQEKAVKEVDDAMARVRDVNRRFPDR